MVLGDVVAADGHIWLKSEWAPASEEWPAVSFSKRSVGERLQREFRPRRDILIYAGTGNPQFTEEPQHRKRLLSALSIEPMQLLETRTCIPAESWERAQRDFRGRWYWSMPALDIWDIEDLPLAHDVSPQSYSQLGLIVNRGSVVEVLTEEREALLQLRLRKVAFEPAPKARPFGNTRTFLNLSREIRDEIARMAGGIRDRVVRGGTEQTRTSPVRTMSETDINIMLGVKWQEQNGLCFLCHGPLLPGTKNYLLQCSPDRIDSQDVAYNEANTRITHLGCNLAKNKVTIPDFEDWLMVVRGELYDLNGEVTQACGAPA
jgi:hypothetical protein